MNASSFMPNTAYLRKCGANPALPKIRSRGTTRVFASSGNGKGNSPWGAAVSSLQKEMRKHVDVNPEVPPPPSFSRKDFLAKDEIRKNEQFALNGWASSKFQVTGVAVALVLALVMVIGGPPPPHL